MEKSREQLLAELAALQQRIAQAEKELAQRRHEKQAEQTNRQEAHQILAETAGSILTVRSLDDLWTLISQAARRVLGADRTAVYIYDPVRNALSCPYAHGLSSSYTDAVLHFFKDLPGSQVLGHKQPLAFNDVMTDPAVGKLRSLMLKEGFKSYAVFPLTASQDIQAAFVLYRDKKQAFTADDLHIGQTLAHIATAALQNVQLLNEAHHALWREQRLNEMTRTLSSSLDLPTILLSIVQMATELVGADAGLLGLVIDGQIMTFYPHNLPPTISLRPAAKGRGVAWQIVESGQSCMVEEYMTLPHAQSKWAGVNIKAFLGVPIVSGEDCLGVITLFNINSEKPFVERDLALAESIGRQAGITIQNARLFAEAKQRATALANALSRQEELDRLKTQFIHGVSHELRTPLGLILGHAELLESGDMGDMTTIQQQSIEIILRRVHMITNLVDDLTALLAAETQEFRREMLHPTQLIESVLAEYRVKATKANVTLQAKMAPDLLWIQGDPTHLRRVFDNLFSNAFKFTPAGGAVTVRAYTEDERVIIQVADTGEGISDEQLPRIFERFYQVQVDGKPRRMGTGLGLALVKEIVEAHRGYVSVQSELGQGTVFQIELPGHPFLESE